MCSFAELIREGFDLKESVNALMTQAVQKVRARRSGISFN